nr:PREDICTED: F-BAR domain only protein 2-like [Apteryx mantelli mantelli]
MTKLAKSASNYTQLGTFAPVWDVFKTSTEKLASCHLDLVRRLQELIKEVHKYGDEQIKAYKKTKEEVSGTLEAVQNIQSITQALQKSKENYNTKCVEQERLKKEGATQREVDKAAVKLKKATDTYKLYVEKYAAVKSDFEQKMTETAQNGYLRIGNNPGVTVLAATVASSCFKQWPRGRLRAGSGRRGSSLHVLSACFALAQALLRVCHFSSPKEV